jgi:Protein of unknown function (DUF3307)
MIAADLIPVLGFLASLQVKHFLCDGPLQTKAMVDSKSLYGDLQGVIHAGLHGLGSAITLFAFQFGFMTVLALALIDGLVHYHIDYVKENIVKRASWTSHDAQFWWALSADQMLHHMTYLLIAAIAFTNG